MGPESEETWRIWDCQIERHFCLVAANNLRRAVVNAAGRFTGMDPELAESVWVLRDVTEHWDEQWPDFYDQRYTGERRRAGARFEQRHPGRSPFIFEAWTSAAGPMLGPDFPSSRLRQYLDLVESTVLALCPEFRRFIAPETPSAWLRSDGGTFFPDPND